MSNCDAAKQPCHTPAYDAICGALRSCRATWRSLGSPPIWPLSCLCERVFSRGGRLVPSPFPGMDPYLEGPAWSSLHFWLISKTAEALQDQLDERGYFAIPGER